MTNTQTFENEDYTVAATFEANCKASFKITAKKPAAAAARKEAIKRVNKQISIPGFRKGRVPDATVLSRYPTQIEREWKEILIENCYKAAVTLSHIYPLNQEGIERPKVLSHSEEEACVSITFEHYPEVPSIDFKALPFTSHALEPVTEAKIQEVIDQIRRSHATFNDVPARPVQEGDFVDISIDAIDSNPPRQVVKERRFEVSKKHMAHWMVPLLIGLEPGQSIEGMSELDENAEDHVRENFKPTQVRIQLHSIHTINLPEMDEALLEKIKISSLDELKERIVQNLEREAQEQQKGQNYRALEEALLQTYSFDLPPTLLQAEKKQRMTQWLAELDKQNLPEDQKQQREAELEQKADTQAKKALTLYFLSRQMAKQGNVSLSNEELSQEVQRQLSYMQDNQDEKTTERMIRKIASNMIEQKTLDYALAQLM